MRRLRSLLALMAVVAAPLAAQTVTFTMSSAGAAFPNPTLANYQAGFVDNTTPITYTVTVASPAAGRTYNTTVLVQATSTTYGTKTLSDLQCGPTTAALQALTSGSTWVTIATHPLTSTTRSASGTIYLRSLLKWTDTGSSYTVPLRFQISVTRI